jgi:hypothetical protein
MQLHLQFRQGAPKEQLMYDVQVFGQSFERQDISRISVNS